MFISAFDTEDEKSKFEKIYYKYRDMLYACALKIVKNSTDAEDVLHDAFIKTAKSIKQIDDISSRRTAAYLTVITKNTAYDRLRRLKDSVGDLLYIEGYLPPVTLLYHCYHCHSSDCSFFK